MDNEPAIRILKAAAEIAKQYAGLESQFKALLIAAESHQALLRLQLNQTPSEAVAAMYADADKRIAKLGAEYSKAHCAQDRLPRFLPDIDGRPQCPRCWLERGERANLAPLPCEDDLDVFRCESCKKRITVPKLAA